MSLKSKRKTFFIVIAVLFLCLFGIVFFVPIMRWSDNLTMQGVMPLGIPLSQLLVYISSIGMAILVTVLFYVDTRVLVDRSLDKKQEDKKEDKEPDEENKVERG